jgi:hypothetical protein
LCVSLSLIYSCCFYASVLSLSSIYSSCFHASVLSLPLSLYI